MSERSLQFKGQTSNRYWWFNTIENNFVPPIFSFLADDEWGIMSEWYKETDSRFSAAEANIPALSFLQGLICGSNIKGIVQLGHYEGFSTLLMGFMLRKMGFKNSLFSVDINETVTERTRYWIKRAGLDDYVFLHIANSCDPQLITMANNYLGSEPRLIFIDSSHQYEHTLAELDLWYASLAKHGMIVLHDVTEFAVQYDTTNSGGVNKAVNDWCNRNGVTSLLLNSKIKTNELDSFASLVYKDHCGIGLIQKN